MKLDQTFSLVRRRASQAASVLLALLFGTSAFAAAPSATNDMLTAANEDAVKTINAAELLGNDTGDGIVITAVTSPSAFGATVTLSANGQTITYDPRSAALIQSLRAGFFFVTPETFQYTVTDTNGLTDSATVSFELHGRNDAPTITGAIISSIGDNVATNLFSGITVGDVDDLGPPPDTITATVRMSNFPTPLQQFGEFDAYPNQTEFTITGTASEVTTALRALRFVPRPNRGRPGETETFDLTLEVRDDSGANSPDNRTTHITVNSINDPATLFQLYGVVTDDNRSANPFLFVEINDPDKDTNDQVLTIQITPNTTLGRFDPATINDPTCTTTQSLCGTEAELELQDLDRVVFTPRENISTSYVWPGQFFIISTLTITDSHGATSSSDIGLYIVAVNDTPDIAGTPVNILRKNDDETVNPFEKILISDVDESGQQQVTVAISFPVAAGSAPLGSFPVGNGLSSAMQTNSQGQVTVVYTLTSRTPTNAQTFLRDLVFTPAQNVIPVGETRTLTFTLTVTDARGASRVNNRTQLAITSINGAPRITTNPGLTQPFRVSPTAPVKPFEPVNNMGVGIEDDETNVTVTISLDDPAKGTLSGGGFTPSAAGVYQRSGTPADLTTAIQALEFQVNDAFLFPPEAPGGTAFTIKAEDSILNISTLTLAIVLQEAPRNWVVTEAEDSFEVGSLRYTLQKIDENKENNAVITFALPEYPATLRLEKTNGPVVLNRNVTFKGPGADMLFISGDSDGNGQPDVQLFRVGAAVTMEGVTLTHGSAKSGTFLTGGAIYVGPSGRLTLRYCAVADSEASQWGGGIDVDEGSLEMSHCLVRGNSTDESLGLGGGAIALYTSQFCSFVNTTFSGNRQRSANGVGGGAVYLENVDPTLLFPVEVIHCTFDDNEDEGGGGTSLHANVFGAMVVVRNSIFADGLERNLEISGAAEIFSAGGNLSDDATRTVLTQNGQPKDVILLDHSSDRTDTDPQLAPLDTGLRPTAMHVLTSGSPAIGLAVGAVEPTDQRGAIRDNDPDSGAAEFNASQRLVMNEIHFDPDTGAGQTDFIEFYALRDSTPVNLGGYILLVNGHTSHVFSAGTIVQPGFGIIVAEANMTLSPADNPTPVETNSVSPLNLESRGLIELKQPGVTLPVLRVDYTGVFADPSAPTQTLNYAHNSLTLAPQFRGFAYLPHSIVLPPPLGGADLDRDRTVNPLSPGKDTGNTPFGSPNAFPVAVDDEILVDEDELVSIEVLDNDLDADGLDRLVIVDVSQSSGPGTGDSATASSAKDAQLNVQPSSAPLQGTAISYDPRSTTNLQSLPEGAKTTDTFYYETIDYGTGPILGYMSNSLPGSTIVISPNHRMTNDVIIISGSSVSNYNNEFTVTRITNDLFSIPVTFAGAAATPGSWVTKNPRFPTQRSEAAVTVTVLGANDPPTPGIDLVTNVTEETIVRMMGDPDLTPAVRGSITTFDTDPLYPAPREISNVSLLANDSDPDTDDDGTTLHVVGVVPSVHTITAYSGTPGDAPVTVQSPNHGLADGTVILISGYGGHRSYNGFHVATVLDSNSFSIPVIFIDSHPSNGVWTVLNDANRLSASSKHGAAVKLEIRTDRIETSIVYNPRTSSHLNGLAVGETEDDEFYYAVQDRHGAVSVALVTVRVTGVNDLPEPAADPASLNLLNSLAGSGSPAALTQVITQLTAFYYLPPVSGISNRADVQVQFSNTTTVASFFLENLWATDEDTALDLESTHLLGNDADVDRSDVLSILLPSTTSREGASLTLNPTGLTYDPTTSSNLNSLAREELLIDSFEITVTDSRGGQVNSLVTILVIGANDTPVARDDQTGTPEDVLLVLDPVVAINVPPPPALALTPDEDVDINGIIPDNRLTLVPSNGLTSVGAQVTVFGGSNVIHYDPSTSAFLDGLARDQTFLDLFEYAVMDGSFVFANDDLFKVAADGANFVLELLANDRNLTGSGGDLRITAVGTPNRGGTVAIDASGLNVVYTPEVNFVGDEVFRYTVSNQHGNIDSGLVTVRVTVNQLNGNLQANHDAFTVAWGQSPVLDVLANDNIIPAGSASLTITGVISPPNQGGVINLVNNELTYSPDPDYPGPYPYNETFRYEISGGGTARATAIVTILVVDRRGTLNIRDDTFSVQTGSRANSLNVLFNDNLLPGSGALQPLTILSFTSPAHGQVTTNEPGDALLYTPDEGYIGQDTWTYVATDGLGGTGTGVVTVAVGHLTTSSDIFVVPFDSTNTVADDGITTLDVLANDMVLQAATGSVSIASVAPTSTFLGLMAVSADGKLLEFNPAENIVGEQDFTYTIQDASGRTAQGKVTVLVVEEGVKANSDYFTVEVDGSANPLDVLANDRALPDRGRLLAIVSVGTGIDAPNRGGTVTINDTNDGLLYTPAPGFSGEETFTYTMTDSRKADTARVVVRVTNGELSANHDAFTVFFEPGPEDSLPSQFTLQVLANDRVLPDFGQLLTITGVGIDDSNASNAPDRQGSVTISDDGTSLIYVPGDMDGPFPYVERFTYEISDGTARRAQATVTVEVQKRINARELETNDDAYSIGSDTLNNVLAVLANDAIKPATTAGWTITAITVTPSNGVASINGSTILYTPFPGFVGTDHLTYAVSDGFGGTGSGLITIKVGDLPLCPDVFVALSGTSNNAFDVLANDAIRPETAADYFLLDAFATDKNGSVTVNDGRVLYSPDLNYAGAYPYVETFLYRVQDDSFGTVTGSVAVTVYEFDSDRDRALLNVTVQGVNDAPTIAGTASYNITDKQTVGLFQTVTIGDVDNQGMEIITARIIIDGSRGLLTNLSGFVEGPAGTYTLQGTPSAVTAAIRQVEYDPIENRITVPTTETTIFTIRVDDGLATVTNDTTVVNVTAINDPPIISGTVSNQTVYHRLTIKPFATVAITEVDDLMLQPLVITVTLDKTTNGFLSSLGGFVDLGGGVYRLGTTGAGVTAAAASAALRMLMFNPTTDGRVTPGFPETTRFTISVEDGFAPPVVDSNTTVIAIHEYVTKLLASDGATTDQFGSAVAASGNLVVVGAFQDDDRGNNCGAAYIFTNASGLSTQWVQVQKLVPADLAAGHEFGNAVAISGNTIAVGAHFGGAAPSAGAVYIFERGPTNWIQVQKLTPFDGANGDEFGFSVSIDKDTLVVGARADDDAGTSSGAAFVYARTNATNWSFVRKLIRNDPAAGDEFGRSVSIHADTIIVGAHLDVTNSAAIGSAYLFGRNVGGITNWGQIKRLAPSDGLGTDGFGFSVGISGDTAVVGSRQHDHVGNDTGSAYLFKRDQGGTDNWGELKEIPSPVALNNDQFGYAVSISRDKFVGGLPFSGFDNQSKYGAAFAFAQNLGGSNNWGTLQRLDRPDPGNNDQFGLSVNIGQNIAAVGVNFDDDRGNDSGSTYIYRLKYNNAPRLVTPIPNQTAATNALFTFTLSPDTFGDADVGDTLTLAATLDNGSPLPVWLSFSPATGTFSGTPPSATNHTIRVTATDEDGATVVATFNLVVSGGGSTLAPSPMPMYLTIVEDVETGQTVLSYARVRSGPSAFAETSSTRAPTYWLETSTDLLSWTAGDPLVVSEAITPLDELLERVTLRIQRTFPRQFFRIKCVAE